MVSVSEKLELLIGNFRYYTKPEGMFAPQESFGRYELPIMLTITASTHRHAQEGECVCGAVQCLIFASHFLGAEKALQVQTVKLS